MTVVIGYVPGAAALAHGLREARLRETRVVVVNSSRGESLVDDRFVQGQALEDLREQLRVSGSAFEIRQSVRGRDVAEERLGTLSRRWGPNSS